MQEYQLYIDGEFGPAKSGKSVDSINPATEEPWARVARAGREDTQRAIKAARTAFDDGPWARMSQQDRARILNDIADRMQARAQEIAVIETQDSGGTIRKTGGDLMLANAQLRYFAEMAEQLPLLDRDPGAAISGAVDELRAARAVRRLRPDHPVELPAHDGGVEARTRARDGQHGRAQACHRHAVLRARAGEDHRRDRPAEGRGQRRPRLAEPSAARSCAPARMVDKIAFTGSTAVGRRIMQLAAGTVKKVTLELGGKSANIILDDADLDMAIDGSLFGCFFHQGQACESGTRLLRVRGEARRGRRAAGRAHQADQLRRSAGHDERAGPAHLRHASARPWRATSRTGVEEGATVAVGGSRPAGLPKGYYVEPTILTDVKNTMKVAQEEIFGPVLVVIRYKNIDEAIKIANDSIYGLGGAVWSRDNDKAMEVAKRVRTGTMWINEYHMLSVAAPFGGYKQSGIGREFGLDGMLEYMQIKHIHVDQVRQSRGQVLVRRALRSVIGA